MPNTESHWHEEDRALHRAKELSLSRDALVRLKCVLFAEKFGITKAADHFGFHRSTVTKWMKQYTPGHPETLEEKSRAPHRVRTPETDPAVVERIRALRMQHPAINRSQIRAELAKTFDPNIVPSESTIGRILHCQRLTQRDLLHLDDAASSGTWNIAAAIVVGVALSLGLGARPAEAAQSTSYTLYDTFPAAVTQITKTSGSYELREDGLSGDARPLVSTSYEMRSPYAQVIATGSSSNGNSSSAASSAGPLPPLPGPGPKNFGSGPRPAAGPGGFKPVGAPKPGRPGPNGLPAAAPGTHPAGPAEAAQRKGPTGT
jgi:transposase